MGVIIILSVVAVFLINLIFIDNIYKIVESPIEPKNNSDKSLYGSFKEALILGDDETCSKISDLLDKHYISSDIFNDIDNIDKSHPYKYLLAMYNDDLENLMACSIASKIMDIKNKIAICNKHYNQKIYDENHILSLMKNASASEIVSLLLNNQSKKEA